MINDRWGHVLNPRTLIILLGMILAVVATSAEARPGTIGPKLRAVLSTATANQQIPVIIRLSDKANISQFRERNLKVRRSRIIKALRNNSDISQKNLKRFIRKQGVTKTKELWLINGMAVKLSAKAIRKLRFLPRVESIELDYTITLANAAAATPLLRIFDATVDEAAGSIVFDLTLSALASQLVTVDYTVSNGTASAGTDFTSVSGQLSFIIPNNLHQTITVPILEDVAIEADETFNVTLSNVANAMLADGAAVGTITDNDASHYLRIDDVTADESLTNATFTASLSATSTQTVTVDYASSNSAATAGADYMAVSGQLSFAPGDTEQTILVPILEDTANEATEDFTITLSNPVGATVADLSASGLILDNDAPAGLPEPNLSLIKAPDVWALGYTGQGIVIASLDSGVDLSHPDLATKWRGGNNSWFDPHNEHPSIPYDKAGHGTQTMGLMVGSDVSGGTRTTTGAAPNARWIAAKIFNDAGDAPVSEIHSSFQWLMDPDGDPETNDVPDVVNSSWGLEENVNQCIPTFQPDIQALKAAGIAVVFSAGNSGPGANTSISPANIAESFAIGAVDNAQNIASFSSRGTSTCDSAIFPEIVAPGVLVNTTDLALLGMPLYANQSGTSFAAPHISAVMALLLSAFPDKSVAELEDALIQSAIDLGTPGADNDYGYGLVDAEAAYDYLHCPPGGVDTDADGIVDSCDNCILDSNPDQRDTNSDGFGNQCDADLNNDGNVNFGDLGALKSVFFKASTDPGYDPDADLNGDGFINFSDLGIMKLGFFAPPGPSGLTP